MAEWYSRADRARMEQGLPPLEHSELTADDYMDLVELAMQEAYSTCRAQDLVGDFSITDSGNTYAGLTSSDLDENGKPTGKYDISIDFGETMRERSEHPTNGQAYVARRIMSVFHEFRHVEQHAMVEGELPVQTKEDMEVSTQMVLNTMYPSLYKRGYETTISEVDADVYGLQGAMAFFDRHPELKTRYGFDFDTAAMRVDEYDVIEDSVQLSSTPDNLLSGMMRYRSEVYAAPWNEQDGNQQVSPKEGSTEELLLNHLAQSKGIGMEQLETMDNDERNVILMQNALEVIEDPAYRGKVASNIRAFATNPIVLDRYDEVIRDYNDRYGEYVKSQSEAVLGSPETSTPLGFERYTRSRMGPASPFQPSASSLSIRNQEIESRWGHLLSGEAAKQSDGLELV